MKTKPDANRKRHILIVDDNEQLAQSYKELLEAGDYSVSIAPNGVVALKHVLNESIDAVICDLKMPQLDGDKFYVTVERVKPD
ncbi:MAG: response regulator, partial [Limisphaerales bacterium]